MKRLFAALGVVLAWAAVASAASSGPLTSLRAVHALTNAEASQRLPVALEATVTYFRGYEHTLFVQDGENAAYVWYSGTEQLHPGDRVSITGTTGESYRPILYSSDVKVLRHEALPDPIPANFSDLIVGQHDCELVKMQGVLVAADVVWPETVRIHHTTIEILTSEGQVQAEVDGDNQESLLDLLDDEVEVIGTAGGDFDGKMQQTGIVLHIYSTKNIKVLKQVGTYAWDTLVMPMSQILAGYHVDDSTSRILVEGTVTYYQPGAAVVLQNGAKSLWVNTLNTQPLEIGDLVEATGFPDVVDGFITLTRAEIKDRGLQAPVAPIAVNWKQLAIPGLVKGVGHHFDLISIEGEVLTEAREGTQDEYILMADGHPFSAVYRHPGKHIPEMRLIPPGTRVRVTGICTMHNANPWRGAVAFDILLRSFDDIEIVKPPSLLSIRNLTMLVGVLLAIMAFVGARGWLTERKVRQKTTALASSIEAEAALERRTAQLEHQRSRILESINASSPLGEILEEILEMLSFMLYGANCWCDLAEGCQYGTPSPQGHRVISIPLDGHKSSSLGLISAALDSEREVSQEVNEALQNGARLATLAIETRKLYTDLRHRSEFDLLTEIPNRFAMDKHLDAMMEDAKQNASAFGLVYIDLDKFKPINDRYGHHVGDLFLQQVAMRMRQQLRSHDMLARLGGDEFAALISKVGSAFDLEEVVQRLKKCFEEPFRIEGYLLHGGASFGVARYPKDATSKDALLSVADAAMYAEKKLKKNSRESRGVGDTLLESIP